MPEARIQGAVDNARRAMLAGSRPLVARAENEAGRMPGTAQFLGASIMLNRSDAQNAALDGLISNQQNPASPQFHQWLSPDEFAAQFGASDADLAKVQGWLASQGFSDISVSRNRSQVFFSGSATQIEQAFRTEMHFFKAGDKTHFGPSSELSLPAAFAGNVLAVGNLSDLRPKPRARLMPPVKANFTSSTTGSHFVTPKDLATIYDINAAYNAGWTGAGQTIAVVGQSAILASDVTAFQTAAGVPVRAPVFTLVPGTGTSTVYTGDDVESDLDVEYTGAVARGATINFVYTGNSANNGGVFTALQYAVTNRIAPIISISYGLCETALGTFYAQNNAMGQQAAAQGQTIVSSSGDQGSVDCYDETGSGLTTAQQTALAVDFPSSSQYVTALGGTEFLAADVATGNTQYWVASNGNDVLGSAVSYIPEMAWNDDSTGSGVRSGGGGASVFTARPSWQTGVPGIPAGSFRLVPDISLASSPNNAGYLYCASDSADTGITGSCSNGFRDANNTYLTVAGGTSFAAPIFAGMLALIYQSKGVTTATGQGVVNPTLYTLAANPATYASAFHDITSGNNACTSGVSYSIPSGSSTTPGPVCPASSAGSFAAGTGYDQATGLGSVDLFNLLSAWPGTTAAAPGTFSVSATAAAITNGNSGPVSITVTPSRGYTGTVNLVLSSNPLIANACYTGANATIASAAPVTVSATLYTSSTGCPANATALTKTGAAGLASTQRPVQPSKSNEIPEGVALAGVIAAGFMGRRSRRLRGAILMALVAVVAGFGLSGCGSASTAGAGLSPTVVASQFNAAKGAYLVTVSAADSVTGATASTTFTLTIQ